MGSNTSKQTCDSSVVLQRSDLDTTAANSDPRSPTPEIIRTPLQGKPGVKHNITKNADLRKTFEEASGEEKLIRNNPILSAVIKNHLQSYDPRSPTQDFERTPIIITSKIDDLTKNRIALNPKQDNFGSPCLKKEEDDNINCDSCAEAQESPETLVPKNLCNDFCDLTLNESSKVSEPLGSSTASNEVIEKDISIEKPAEVKPVLETNFDYVEDEATNLDGSNESNDSMKNVDTLDDLLEIPQFKILPDDPRSPSAGIKRTPIVVSKTNDTSEKNVEDMSDATLIKVLQSANADLRHSTKSKNEGVLIYEDDDTINFQDTPKKSRCQSGTTFDARTPLSCMKNKTDVGHLRSKSANDSNAKVATKVRRASHIPRLKALAKHTKLGTTGSSVSLKNLSRKSVISGDCENTPPHSHRDKWDKESSIVL